jgi:signal transduction histidine kinase
MDKRTSATGGQADLAKMEQRMNHVTMGGGIVGLVGYSIIEYFITPGLWGEFLIYRSLLALLGAALMTYSMVWKRGIQATFYAFWIPMLLFGAYGASRMSAVPLLLAWNIHICFYVLFIASTAVSPLRLTWLLSASSFASYVAAFLVRPGLPFIAMLINGGLLYLCSLFVFPFLMLVRYRLFLQNAAMRSRIAAQNDELRLSNASKDRFFSLLAHDLKGPIGSSMRVLERLRGGDVTNAPEELAAVSEAVSRAYALLENLLWWARSQRGELTVLPVELSVEQLVARAWREVEPGASRKQIGLDTEIDRGDFVVADKKLAHTILLNLLSNAVKFSAPGGRVTVSTLKRDGRLVIEVRDTGAGMDQEKIAKLFRIDEKQSEANADGERGSGLGLIVSREFAEKNGGSLRVTSALGQGSSFYLELPSA